MINAGQYDQRVTLQRRTPTRDTFGQESLVWIDIATVWAKVRPAKGRDRFAAGGVQPSIDVQFFIRYRVDINSSCRVVWNSVPYAISGEPSNTGAANIELEINCVRGMGDDA